MEEIMPIDEIDSINHLEQTWVYLNIEEPILTLSIASTMLDTSRGMIMARYTAR